MLKPVTIADQIEEILTRHSIDLMRVNASLHRKVIRKVNGLEKTLVKQMTNANSISDQLNVSRRLANLDRFLGFSNTTIEKSYKEIFNFLNQDFKDLADVEARTFAGATNQAVKISLMDGVLTERKIKLLVDNTLVLGAQMDKLWLKASDKLKFDYERVLRQGIINNETIPQLVSRVRGTRALGYKDGIMTATRNQAATIVRTSTMTVANRSRDLVINENKSVLNGTQWLSTLDSKTCFIAGTRVYAVDSSRQIENIKKGDFVRDKNNKLIKILATKNTKVLELIKLTFSHGSTITCTPEHLFLTNINTWIEAVYMNGKHNIVCVDGDTVKLTLKEQIHCKEPVTVYDLQTECKHFTVEGLVVHNSDICKSLDGSAWDFDQNPIQGTSALYARPPIHPNCRSTIMNIVKSWEQLSKTKDPKVRKILKAHRPPKRVRASMDGAVSAGINYEDWLKTKPVPFQIQTLGKVKQRLWADGKINFSQLIDQSHNPLSPEQLLAKVAGREALTALGNEAEAIKKVTTNIARKKARKVKTINEGQTPVPDAINLKTKKPAQAEIEAAKINTTAFYNGFIPELANGFNESIQAYQKNYPLFKDFEFFVGSGSKPANAMLEKRALNQLSKAKKDGSYSNLTNKLKKELTGLTNLKWANKTYDRLYNSGVDKNSQWFKKNDRAFRKKNPKYIYAKRMEEKYTSMTEVTAKEIDDYYVIRVKDSSDYSASKGAFAETFGGESEHKQVLVRAYSALYKDKEKLIRSRKRHAGSGFKTKTSANLPYTSTITHELGHNLDYFVRGSKYGSEWREWLQDYLFDQSMKGNSISNGISRYAASDLFETVAEAFADFWSGGNTTKMSSDIITKLNEFYKLLEDGI